MKANLSADLIYIQWKEEYRHVLESLPGKQIYMLFSGGKDSSMSMDFFLRAAKDFGFDFEAHAATFPVHRYSDEEKKRIGSYWSKQGVNIIWHDPDVTDDYINNSTSPCLACQELRKKILKKILTDLITDWNKLVLVVSYSLWDIVSYCLEHLLSEIFSDSDNKTDVERNYRFKETAQRFYPLLKMKEGYTIFRPLIKSNNDDILKIISQKEIPTLSIPCKFKDLRPKNILENYYKRMGLRFDYNQVFDFAKKSLNLPDMSSYTSIEKEEYLRRIF